MRSFANRFTDMVFRAREFFHLSEYVLGDSLRYDDDTVHVANDDVDGRDVDADDDRIRAQPRIYQRSTASAGVR